MTYELLAAQKATGNTLNLTNSTTQVVWSTQRTGQPGKLTFTYLRTPESKLEEGDVIRFSVNGQLQFYGWVFTRDFDRWGPVDVVCYDRIRYLKANASYSFYGQSAGDIIRQIAEDFELDVGELAGGGTPAISCPPSSCRTKVASTSSTLPCRRPCSTPARSTCFTIPVTDWPSKRPTT